MRSRRAVSLTELMVAAFSSLSLLTTPAVAERGVSLDGILPGQDKIEGAIDLAKQLKDLLTKDADVGVWVSAKTDGPDADDFSFNKDKDLDDIKGETNLKATALAEAQNNVDDFPTDTPYTPNPSHYATIILEAECTLDCYNPFRSATWNLVSHVPNLDEVWIVAQDDKNEDPPTNTGETKGAAAGIFSEDGKTAEACFKANVTNKQKNNGKAFEWEKQDVKKVEKEKCSPRRPFRVTTGGYLMADEDMFEFVDVGSDGVRIEPQFGPVVDLFHTYWQRQETKDLFPVLRGYGGVVEEVRRDAYASRAADAGLHLTEDPSDQADFTVVGAGLSFSSLEVSRAGRTNLQLLEEYFASPSVDLVAPEHAQEGYAPGAAGRMVIHSGDDISSFIGRPYLLPGNERRDGGGSDDQMVGILVSVSGNIEHAVKLAANTPGQLLYRRLGKAWDGSRTIRFALTDMAIHHENAVTIESTHG